MDEPEICKTDQVVSGEDGIFTNNGECSRSNCGNNVNSLGLYDVLKCFLLKYAMDGADKVFKDQKLRKTNFPGTIREEGSNLPNDYRVFPGKYARNRKTNEVHHSLQEKERVVCTNLDEKVLEPRRDHFYGTNSRYNNYIDASETVNSSSGVCIGFPLNIIVFLAVFLIRFVGFQVNLFISFITFPIWLSYFSFMFLLFPFQIIRHVRGYLMAKVMRMLGVSSEIVTVKAKKSMGNVAMRFGWAFFCSVYVCFKLLGLLVSGFLFGGILMRCLVVKPFQATESLNFDYTKSSPVAFVPIMSYPGINNPSSLTVKDSVEAAKDSSARAIPYNHKLQLTVSLTVPESEYNRKLGVFQVRVEFLSENGKVTASSSNPCMLQFKSQPIHFVQTILKSVPLIAGFQSESQILNIKMNEFREGLEPTACLKVILEQRVKYKSGAVIPEIYAASLAVESQLPQVKRIIWYWRRTIFVWSSFMLFLAELVVVLVFCRTMIVPRGRTKIVYDKKDSPLNIISWYKSG